MASPPSIPQIVIEPTPDAEPKFPPDLPPKGPGAEEPKAEPEAEGAQSMEDVSLSDGAPEQTDGNGAEKGCDGEELQPTPPSEAAAPAPAPTAAAAPPPPPASSSHRSTASVASTASLPTSTTTAPSTHPSASLLLSSLDALAQTREGHKPPLSTALTAARNSLTSSSPDPRTLFEPLRLGTHSKATAGLALDGIAKLVGSAYFTPALGVTRPLPDAEGQGQAGEGAKTLADVVTETVCECFPTNGSGDDRVQLQIVKALLAIVLSSPPSPTTAQPTSLIHHSTLLAAVRTVYNVFLLGKDPANQMVAQAGLTQMVNTVFSRVRATPRPPPSRRGSGRATPAPRESPRDEQPAPADIPLPPPTPTEDAPAPNGLPKSESKPDLPEAGEKMTLQTFERRRSFDASSMSGADPLQAPPLPAEEGAHVSEEEILVKDAFLVFRALCKLSMKPLQSDSDASPRSPAFRSKLLSLHLIHAILSAHMALFTDPAIVLFSSTREPTQFLQAVKQYLCLSLSRNAVSQAPQVFEISVEIFWRVLRGMRGKLKREIEVLLHEIFLPILELRNTSVTRLKSILASTLLARLSADPQALVELYLNYDCDRTALDNIYEHLMNVVSKLVGSHGAIAPSSPSLSSSTSAPHLADLPPSLSTAALALPHPDPTTSGSAADKTAAQQALEGKLKRQALEVLVAVLASLVAWAERGGVPGAVPEAAEPPRASEDDATASPTVDYAPNQRSGTSTPDLGAALGDDPTQFESAKQRKTTLMEGIKKFNFKPKRGIQFLIDTGFIRSRKPRDIAQFLLTADGLNKAQIGEYLGEGEDENIAIMHAFVDLMDFSGQSFVDALRVFLQSFRLPGESQKIDRYMLKFAERYVQGNPTTLFANADTAYVMAYSVILLNTDAYNPQNKRRMTKDEFIRNNRGINDGADLPEEYLSGVYDEIHSNEIRMKDEVEAALPSALPPSGMGIVVGALSGAAGRDFQKEAYVLRSEGMANKTEALFKTMLRSQRRGGAKAPETFFSASHFEHVRPMFEVAWMAFLSGVSGPLQETDDPETIALCLSGFANAIKIACLFDLELERNAFVTTLAKFTFLNNLGEMKPKNVEAIKALLEVAEREGNYLKGSWREVLNCVSQLERFQLMGTSAERAADVRRASTGGRQSMQASRQQLPSKEVAADGRSIQISGRADLVFSNSQKLSGTAIVDFAQALADVSWEEIMSSGLSDRPRLFSLQKLVDISYYNMNRIRLEWSKIWVTLGDHFNKVCCHSNPAVSFFAIDALRQLAMRFLEKEELAHFGFQKDFLKPFEHTMVHNPHPDARDMVLQCLHQMIQARAQNIRSGWRTMFGVFSAASKVTNERVVSHAFDIVARINREHFGSIIRFGTFADLTVCITDFCKVTYQRVSLQAIAMLRGVILAMLSCPECPLSRPDSGASTPIENGAAPPVDDPMIKYWFPVLFSFFDIIMNGDDLEVRRLALDSLFDTLKQYGSTFRPDFWDTVCQEVLFPIFAVLKSTSDVSRFSTSEDMTVWLSTTMVQALRNLIDLYTHYFDTLERTLDGLLDLLRACICQENDTLARIGTSCFQQLLEQNVHKLNADRWQRIVSTFIQLFKTTTAHQLFDESLRSEQDPASPTTTGTLTANGTASVNGFAPPTAPLTPGPERGVPPALTDDAAAPVPVDRRRAFKQIIVKCVLQLLLIETTHELLANDDVYNTIPPEHLLRLMGVLDDSYVFARKFNADQELRMALWKVGFMKQLPNLLKQESSSASTLVTVLLRMYNDPRPEHRGRRKEVTETLVPLGLDVMRSFNALDAETKHRNIAAWTPVVAEILAGFCTFDDETFGAYLPQIYPVATDVLGREIASEVREALRKLFVRVGALKGL